MHLRSVGFLLGLLSIYWLHFDHSVHASSRYYLRTALVIATPLLGALAALTAMTRKGLSSIDQRGCGTP